MQPLPFAIYFPQFYPIPTNDVAWGKGFSDWRLVEKANILKTWAPRKPKKGFYDGSSDLIHTAQIREAKAANLGGFAVYHYWFYSHQELNAFEKTLLSSDKDLSYPWFLIWATESWTKRWAGDSGSILNLSKSPSPEEIKDHCLYLTKCFQNPNYYRLEGKPVFVFYNLSHFENPKAIVENYRQCFLKLGTEVSLGHFIKSPSDSVLSHLVDFNYLFEPRLHFNMNRSLRGKRIKQVFDFVRRILGENITSRLLIAADLVQQKGQTFLAPDYISYLNSPKRQKLIQSINTPIQEVISPGWNNTPRYGEKFTALENLTAEEFGFLVKKASASCTIPPLINAWNEWSEGAAIEPCEFFGTRYLDSIH